MISDNEIVPGPLADPDDPQAGNGIMVGDYTDFFDMPFHRGSILIAALLLSTTDARAQDRLSLQGPVESAFGLLANSVSNVPILPKGRSRLQIR